MSVPFIERLESRVQFSAIQYGVAASGDPDVTGVLAETGPGLKDLGAKGVRLFTNTSFLSSDFDVTPGGKVYVRNPSLVNALSHSKKYHDAGFAVTLCIQLSVDRSMMDGSVLVDPATGEPRTLTPNELRSPKVFRTWYDTISRAQISKTDRTSVTRVIDFWEIGNEPNHNASSYWPVDTSTPGGIEREMDSYVDHDLVPAYDVLSKIHEPVIGAGLASGTLEQFDSLNNQRGDRRHQYSNHCDYLNFHPYGTLNTPIEALTPEAEVKNFTIAMYHDGTVKKQFVITEYNLTDFGHPFPLDPNPNPRDTAEQLATANDLDAAHTALLNTPRVQTRCAWIYYYRLVAQERTTRGALFYPRPDGKSPHLPLTPLYDMFKSWATDAPAAGAPKTAAGVLNLDAKSVVDAMAAQTDGKTLVVSDDGVRRYDAIGKLDPTYGVKGFAALPLIGKAAALQGDGNLIVAGMQNDGVVKPSYHLVVTRVSSSGKIDSTFATNGTFTLADGSGSMPRSVALRAGKILVVGQNRGPKNGILLRLDLTGQLDTTFAGGGATVVKNLGQFSDVAIAKSGAITTLVSPYALSPQTQVVRFTRDGELDTTFSGDGISDPQRVIADGMFADATGVLLVGHTPLEARQILTRYTAAGTIDTSFGINGSTTPAGKNFIRGNTIETPDGSRYLYGSIASTLTSDTKHLFLAKVTAEGEFDLAFSAKGVLTLSSTNVQDLPFAAAIRGDKGLTIAAGVFTQSANRGMSQELFLV